MSRKQPSKSIERPATDKAVVLDKESAKHNGENKQGKSIELCWRREPKAAQTLAPSFLAGVISDSLKPILTGNGDKIN